ncbi:MAG: serine hydrolase [bacterium]
MRYTKEVETSGNRAVSYVLWFLGLGLLLLAANLYSRHSDKNIAFSKWSSFIKEIKPCVEEYPYNAGLIIHDLKYGFSYSSGGHEKFISASLIKLPIMCAVFKKAHEGEISLHDTIVLKKHHKVSGSGSLRKVAPGAEYSIIGLIKIMISESDNTAAKMLTEHIGIDEMNRVFEEMGLEDTNISDQSFRMTGRRVKDESYTTPYDIAGLLERIYFGEFLSNNLSAEIVEILKLPEDTSRLSRYLPEQFELAHKTGLLRGACHDAGILFTPRGDYLICVMTKQNRQYAAAKKFIAQIGKLAYQQI